MNLEILLYSLWVACILLAVIHLCFYLFTFSKLSFYKAKPATGSEKPVSVIICARNEVNNLRKNIPAWMDQVYPDFEVIIVNDCSWDESGEYLKEITAQYPRMKVVTIAEQERYRTGKKFAVTLGIKAAKNEVLLFSDADCRPASNNWIALMQARYGTSTEIVLGYGPYNHAKGFVNRLIRFDTFQVAMQYFSFALSGNAYMGVGRNLSYTKTLFFRNKGFAKHNHLLSGDDDLFVNENATSGNVAVELGTDSFTFSEPRSKFSDWLKQKRRHDSTSSYYRGKHKVQLAMLGLSNLLFYGVLITLLIFRYRWEQVLGLYILKLIIQWIVSLGAAKRLREQDLLWIYPVHELIHTLLQPVFYLSSVFTKKHAWK